MKPTRHPASSHHTDLFLRRCFQRICTAISPPPGGKLRLLQAAAATTGSSRNRFNLWQAFIETQRYIPTHNLIHWSITSCSTEGILPVAKVFYLH